MVFVTLFTVPLEGMPSVLVFEENVRVRVIVISGAVYTTTVAVEVIGESLPKRIVISASIVDTADAMTNPLGDTEDDVGANEVSVLAVDANTVLKAETVMETMATELQ